VSSNADIVRRIVDHLNEHDRPGPEELHAPDMKFFTRGEAAGSPTRYDGFDGLVQAYTDIREIWAELRAEPIEMVEEGDVVVARFRFLLKSRAGVPLETEETWVYLIRDGRIQVIEQFGDRRDAFKAAGIPPAH
jgi:ketosteroid isomerase-like protein